MPYLQNSLPYLVEFGAYTLQDVHERVFLRGVMLKPFGVVIVCVDVGRLARIRVEGHGRLRVWHALKS